ncbi:voltage-gated potassium channel [Aureococcus anophagefferens]|nr:voltage-gated potassium channel [Aureococcus anophagefferens]
MEAQLVPGAAAKQPAKRAASAALVGLAVFGLVVFAGARLQAGAPAVELDANELKSHAHATDESSSKVSATLTYEDFTAYASVKEYLRDYAGVSKDDWSTYDDLEIYVPREITVDLDVDRVAGSIGTAAVEGHVVWGLTYSGSNDFSAAYLIVMDLRGKLKQLSPVYGKYMLDNGYTVSDDKDVKRRMFQPLGLKMFNSSHVLLALSDDGTSGPRALWDWKEDTWTSLCEGESGDSHDIQWAYEDAAIWQVDGTTKVEEIAVSSNENLAHFAEEKVQDPNHCQATEKDTQFYISSRQTNSIIKMNVNGTVEYTLGGEYGDYKIVEYDGTVYKAGDVVWSGQHNAEYFGEDEFCMFDNQEETYAIYDESRMLCVKLEDYKETKSAATCSGKRYCSNPGGGWYAYSIERVYEAPIVANVRCDGTTITFDAYNTFKQMNTFPGTYTITAAVGDDDDGTVTGDFDFEAHWRAASVSVDVPFDTSSAEITITNQFGESTTAATGC